VRLSVDKPLAPGTAVRFEVPGTTLQGTGTVIFTHALESPMRTRFSVGVRLDIAQHARRRWRLPTLTPTAKELAQ
jgi:hypothetical protein